MWSGGTLIPRDQLKVGHIVFFHTTRPGPSHAGIYVGNNLFVHAASAFGRGRVTSMDYRYTTRSATWARADFRQSQFLLGLYLACRVRWWL